MVEEKNSSRRRAEDIEDDGFRRIEHGSLQGGKNAVSAGKSGDEFLDRLCYDNSESERNSSKEPSNNNRNKQLPNLWGVFLHLLINPKLGWRKLKKFPYQSDEFARKVFYPLLAIMSVCRFADILYHNDVSIAPLLQEAIAGFVAFFGGYFLAGMLARSFLPTEARKKIAKRFGQIYIMTIMSALVVCAILYELLPGLGLLLAVPPIYCCYILAKGIKCLRIPERENIPAMILMIVLCIGIPTAIYSILCSLMPSA